MNAITPTTSGGHCMRCNAQREIKNIREITLKNGRPAINGICELCGTTMFKIGPRE